MIQERVREKARGESNQWSGCASRDAIWCEASAAASSDLATHAVAAAMVICRAIVSANTSREAVATPPEEEGSEGGCSMMGGEARASRLQHAAAAANLPACQSRCALN